MTGVQMVEKLAEALVPRSLKEFRSLYPDAEAKFYIDAEGRGVIKILVSNYVVGMEFIETEASWSSKKRMWEYYVALVNKCRLVVYAPKEHADAARMRMLELNNYWLNYYQVFSYDNEMNIEKIGRPRVLATSPLRAAPTPLGGYL